MEMLSYFAIILIIPAIYIVEWSFFVRVKSFEKSIELDDYFDSKNENFFQFPLIRHPIYLMSFFLFTITFFIEFGGMRNLLLGLATLLVIVGSLIKMRYHDVI